jgi:hypothetical protein
MPRKSADPYAAIAADRAKVHDFTVTFAHGQELTGTMNLSVAQVEMMLRNGDITPAVYCQDCDEHIVVCPKVGHLLLEWPSGWSWRGEGLVTFVR